MTLYEEQDQPTVCIFCMFVVGRKIGLRREQLISAAKIFTKFSSLVKLGSTKQYHLSAASALLIIIKCNDLVNVDVKDYCHIYEEVLVEYKQGPSSYLNEFIQRHEIFMLRTFNFEIQVDDSLPKLIALLYKFGDFEPTYPIKETALALFIDVHMHKDSAMFSSTEMAVGVLWMSHYMYGKTVPFSFSATDILWAEALGVGQDKIKMLFDMAKSVKVVIDKLTTT